MTPQKILALPVGLELDGLVALALGWRTHGRAEWCPPGTRSGFPTPPPFSGQILAAWKAVEYVKDRAIRLANGDVCDTFSLDWRRAMLSYGPASWVAGWHDLAGSERIGSVQAQGATAPLAICRAVLLAEMQGGSPS